MTALSEDETGMGVADQKGQLERDIATFFDDPLGYVLYAFDWGQGELAGHDGPDHWQRQLLSDLGESLRRSDQAQQFATASGHGVGKGAVCAWLVLWAMSTRPHLSGIVTANTARQLDTKTWRELALWHKRAVNGHWFACRGQRFYHRLHPQTWSVSALAWSEQQAEAFAGLHAKHVLVLFDEASAIPDGIWEVCDGAMTTPGAMWFAFGNPTRTKGRFRECFGRFAHRWNTRRVDSRKSRFTHKGKLDEWIADYGEDSDFVRVRVRGEFPRAESGQFISHELVAEARSRQATRCEADPLVMGVDVARFGDDQSVLLLRQGNAIVHLERLRGLDTMQLASRVSEAIECFRPKAVFIDGVGVGGGVVDRLRQLGQRVVDVNAGGAASRPETYANKRAEMWGALRDWLRRGSLPDDPDLAEDLSGPGYHFDARNRLLLESKDVMKRRGLRSPDAGDALSLTFAQPVGRSSGGPAKAKTDFKIL